MKSVDLWVQKRLARGEGKSLILLNPPTLSTIFMETFSIAIRSPVYDEKSLSRIDFCEQKRIHLPPVPPS